MNDLRDFNPAYRTSKGTISSSLLLPKSAADQYKLGPVDPVADVADPVADDADAGAPVKSAKQGKTAKAAKAAKNSRAVAKTGKSKTANADEPQVVIHKVNNGESLWTIARRHQVSVEQLMKWNDLQTQAVKPGQVLKLTASR
jgi:membrane-bound lytic murein transglycosylase D